MQIVYTIETCKIKHTNYTHAYSFFIMCTEFYVMKNFFPPEVSRSAWKVE